MRPGVVLLTDVRVEIGGRRGGVATGGGGGFDNDAFFLKIPGDCGKEWV